MAKRVLPAAAVGVFMLLLILRPDYFLNSAARGLLLFASSVLPAIFPFFFCSSLLTAMGAANSLSRLGARFFRHLFELAHRLGACSLKPCALRHSVFRRFADNGRLAAAVKEYRTSLNAL